MTERLYYLDAYQTEFVATLLAVGEANQQPTALLDRTCFYPTSGGQPFDTGWLGGQRVVDVIATKEGEVLHLLEQPLTSVAIGQTLQGVIDWPRRYDHSQQHSGQHLLSQVFYRLFGYETVSVHFGATESTLDLDTPTLEPGLLEEAEAYANDLVYRALPISAYFVNDAELGQAPLRRPPKVSGQIRIVEIDKFDYSACGGTHCHTTAEIGPIKLTRSERRRNQARITFLCGKRAYRDYVAKHQLVSEIANLFDNEISQTPKLVERNLSQLKDLQRLVETLTERLLGYEAAVLIQRAEWVGDKRLVARIYNDKDINAVKTLASFLCQQAGTVVLLGSVDGGKLTLVFARAADVDLHTGNLLRGTLKAFGGAGGGRPDFAQGGGVDPGLADKVLGFAYEQVKNELQQP